MAEERNQVAIPPEANPNVQAEDDLKQVAELKAQAPMKEEGQPVTQEPGGEKYANPDTNGKLSEGQEGGVADEDMEAKEEARIIAAAAKLGQDAESKSESKSDSKDGELKDTNSDQRQSSRGGRGANRPRVNYRDNIKSDVSTLKETSDPDEIRKQVRFPHMPGVIVFFKKYISHMFLTSGLPHRSNSTSLIRIFSWTNSSSPKWAAAKIAPSNCPSCTHSSV